MFVLNTKPVVDVHVINNIFFLNIFHNQKMYLENFSNLQSQEIEMKMITRELCMQYNLLLNSW